MRLAVQLELFHGRRLGASKVVHERPAIRRRAALLTQTARRVKRARLPGSIQGEKLAPMRGGLRTPRRAHEQLAFDVASFHPKAENHFSE